MTLAVSALREEAKRLYDGGMNFADISQRLSIGTGSLYNWAHHGGWTDSKKQEAQKLVEGGMNSLEAARQLEVSPRAIRRWSKAGGWEGLRVRRGKQEVSALREEAQSLVEEGATFVDAARQLEVDPTMIRRWASAGNWQTHPTPKP